MLPCEGKTPSGKKRPFSSSPLLCHLLRRPPRLFKETFFLIKINLWYILFCFDFFSLWHQQNTPESAPA